MLNLGIIIPQLTKYGGAERLLIECVARWQDQHRITLYATDFNEPLLAEHGIAPGVVRSKLSPHFHGEHATLLNATLLPKLWQQEIGEHDVYHMHLWPTHLLDLHPSVWYPHEPLRAMHDLRYNEPIDESGVRPVRTLHVYPKPEYDSVSDSLHEASLDAIAGFDQLGRPDRIVANSKYTAAYLGEVYGRKVSDVVYPGVCPDDFMSPLQDSSTRFPDSDFHPGFHCDWAFRENIFLTIGQLWPHKRTGLAIEAIKLVENCQLYVVGSGPELPRLRRMAENLGVADRVFFLENLTNFELRILFARCQAVVFVPVREPFGIVALETMAAGKPLIGADEGGYAEVVDKSCAFLVPPRPDLIADRMRLLLNDQGLGQRMGLAARRKAKRFTWDRTARELIAIIEDTHRTWNRARASSRATKRRGRTLVGVQYYCWYGEGSGSRHWNDTPEYGAVTDMPLAGCYGSSKGVAIEQHLQALDAAGVDFALLNVHVNDQGIDEYEWTACRNVFSVADKTKSKLNLAVHLCPYNCQKEQMAKAIALVRKQARASSRYLRVRGQPLLGLFWTGEMDGHRQWLRFLRDSSEDFTVVACSLRRYEKQTEEGRTFGLFDGWSLFSPLDLGPEGEWERIWRAAYRQSGAGRQDLRIITVSPGYDDSHLQSPAREKNRFRTVDHRGGATYRRMWDFALAAAPAPDLVIISTFNEYHENTHIEASLNHGSLFMDMTADFARKGKKAWTKR